MTNLPPYTFTSLALVFATGCAMDNVRVAPRSSAPGSLVAAGNVQPPVHVDSGCTSIIVNVEPRGSATARQDLADRCGDVVFEVDRQVARSAGGDTIAISFSLHNASRAAWRAPMWLFIDDENVSASDSLGGVPMRSPLLFGSDTTMTARFGMSGLRHGWQLRRAVPDSIMMRVYPGGETARDTIQLVVDPTAASITLPVRAYVALLDPVGPVAPRGLTSEVQRELSSGRTVVTDSKRITGPFARNYILLYFNEDTNIGLKQLTVDMLGGDVVGGYPMTPGGWYLIRLPETTSEDALFDAIELMDSLPQVRWVTRMILGETRLHVRPDDGSNWRVASWRLDKTRTSGHTCAMERI